ncbi:hypothetical protein LTS08_007259 [Lithohypha guttulata]|nr:hypothetical protein LTS08_007259 [Lithohypha guttulata]
MASPVLSRTPSAHFAPGPHRRSHPNLQNLHSLSLAPLTPKYPIDPADYDAYYDPVTSELHTSTSLSRIAALPSPGGILSNSPAHSRSASRNRLRRKVKSHVNIFEPEREPENLKAGQDVVDHKPVPSTTKSQPLLGKLRINQTPDPSWLVQTGLSLTESSRETKGQSWISKRDSSTSLVNTPEGYFDSRRQREGRTPRSGRATPARSRVGSRNVSRNQSRSRLGKDLKMTTSTSVAGAAAATPTPGASFATAPDTDERIREEDEDDDVDVEPNWADPKTQAELAAQLQEELAAEYEEDDDDPYGMLDFEGQGTNSEDEEEVRQAMRKWRVGGWMDGAIEALLLVEPGRADDEPEEEQGGRRRVSISEDSETDVEEPPEQVRGLWDDIAWLGRLFRRHVI